MCLTEESKKRYRDFLRELAQKKSNEIFSNGGKDHAIVLYQILLENTQKCVRIFCEAGVSAVWQDSELQDYLKNFVEKKDSKLRILVESHHADSFSAIRQLNDADVEIRHISADGLKRIHEHFDNDNCNFAVFDTDKYRYEYDKKAYKAYGSFNRPAIAETMIQLFDEVYADAAV